jgi:hypothetical protein
MRGMANKEKTQKQSTQFHKLAQMIERGNEKLARLVHHSLTSVDGHLTKVAKRLGKVEDDIMILRRDTEAGFQDIKDTLRPLTDASSDHTAQLADRDERLERVEKKIGIGKWPVFSFRPEPGSIRQPENHFSSRSSAS